MNKKFGLENANESETALIRQDVEMKGMTTILNIC